MSINRTKILEDLEINDEGITIITNTANGEKVFVPHENLVWLNNWICINQTVQWSCMYEKNKI